MNLPAVDATNDATNDFLERDRFGGRQVSIVLLCLLFNMIDGFDITAMAVIASTVGREMGLADDQLGLLFSVALAGMMVGAMFLAAVSDLVGRRRVILVSLLLIGTTVLMSSRADSLWELVAWRFASGLGAGAMLASQAALAAEYSPERYRALAVAAVTAGYPLGAMMTGIVANWLMPNFGWRGVFVFGGAVTLSMAGVAALFIPESLHYLLLKRPKGALRRVNAILAQLGRPALERLPALAGDAPPPGRPRFAQLFNNMGALLERRSRRRTLMLWLAFFLCFGALYFLMSWIPKLMEGIGFSAQSARWAFTLFNLGGVIGVFTLGALSTRWKLTHLVSLFLLASALGMVVFAMAPTELGLLLALIFFIGITQQGGFTGLYAVAAKCYATQVRSTGIGWSVGLGRLGAVAGPAVAGWALASGVSIAGNFYLFAVPMALGAIVAYQLHVK